MNDALKQRFEEIILNDNKDADYININACVGYMMQAQAEAEQDKWVSVETPPESSDYYLIYEEEGYGIAKAFYDFSSNQWVDNEHVYYPTFWQPLPKSPISK